MSFLLQNDRAAFDGRKKLNCAHFSELFLTAVTSFSPAVAMIMSAHCLLVHHVRHCASGSNTADLVSIL